MRYRAGGFLLAMIGVAACATPKTLPAPTPERPATDLPSPLVSSCSGCHVADGTAISDLSAYSEERLQTTLSAYRADRSGPTVMHRIAWGLSDDDIALIAAELSKDEAIK